MLIFRELDRPSFIDLAKVCVRKKIGLNPISNAAKVGEDKKPTLQKDSLQVQSRPIISN